jgi:hypothetical protein
MLEVAAWVAKSETMEGSKRFNFVSCAANTGEAERRSEKYRLEKGNARSACLAPNWNSYPPNRDRRRIKEIPIGT